MPVPGPKDTATAMLAPLFLRTLWQHRTGLLTSREPYAALGSGLNWKCHTSAFTAKSAGTKSLKSFDEHSQVDNTHSSICSKFHLKQLPWNQAELAI